MNEFMIQNSFVISEIIKTVFTVIVALIFIACIPGTNNRGRYDKDNNSNNDNNIDV